MEPPLAERGRRPETDVGNPGVGKGAPVGPRGDPLGEGRAVGTWDPVNAHPGAEGPVGRAPLESAGAAQRPGNDPLAARAGPWRAALRRRSNRQCKGAAGRSVERAEASRKGTQETCDRKWVADPRRNSSGKVGTQQPGSEYRG